MKLRIVGIRKTTFADHVDVSLRSCIEPTICKDECEACHETRNKDKVFETLVERLLLMEHPIKPYASLTGEQRTKSAMKCESCNAIGVFKGKGLTGREYEQDGKLARNWPQDWKQGEAEDKACEGSQIARPKDEQSVPPTH